VLLVIRVNCSSGSGSGGGSSTGSSTTQWLVKLKKSLHYLSVMYDMHVYG